MSNPLSSATKALFDAQLPDERQRAKRVILEAALQAFDERGVDATKIEDVRTRSGASVGSIYHHFGTKDGLVAALFFLALDSQLEGIDRACDAHTSLRDVVGALIFTYVTWVEVHPELARFLYAASPAMSSGAQAEALRTRNRDRYRELSRRVRAAMKAREIRALPAELVAPLIFGQTEAYARAWLAGRMDAPPSMHADLLAAAAWASLRVGMH